MKRTTASKRDNPLPSPTPFHPMRRTPRICLRSISAFVNAVALSATGIVALSGSAHAASQTWRAIPTDSTWAGTGNWGASGTVTPPGNTTGATTNDVATFNTALSGGTIGGSGNPIVIDSGRTIGGITFDTASVGAYVIGTNAGNALKLSNIGAGPGTHVIQMTSTVASSQIIAAPITFVAPSSTNGIFGFVNHASSSSATLTLSGTMTNAVARPAIVMLDGANTGTNAITGNISFTAATQGAPYLIKRGAGTWILSGTNAFTGTPMTDTTGNAGIQVLDGVLSAQNNAALGTNATANTNQVWIGNKSLTYVYNTTLTNTFSSVSGGTLEITNGITLDNGLSLNLFNGGTIRGVGAAGTNGRINLSTAAATNATISTVNAADVFTIGNGASDFTGGAADTVVHISGPGTVVNAQSSTNYLGTISIDAGALRNGSSTNGLGSAGVVTFGSGSTGKLQLGNNLGLTSLTTHNATPTAGIVETGVAGTQTLTLTPGLASTYAGTLRNGTGTLALTKAGSSTLTLSGSSNTYSGATTISGGVLNVTNASGSATGTSSVALNSGTLTGAGFITGTVTATNTGILTPGTVTAGSAGSGVLTLGNLTMVSGTTLNFGLVSTGNTPNSNNYISTGALTLPASGVILNLYTPGTSTPFAAAGIYNLFQYASLPGVALTNSTFSFGTSIAGYNASFGVSGGFLQLTLAQAGALATWTNGGATGNWSLAGNWSGTGTLPPQAAGDSATFGATAPGTVNLDANETVGGITFNNASAFTISSNNSSVLTLDNTGSGVTITATTGSHSVQNAVAFNDNVSVSTASGTQLTIAGDISQVSGTRSLTKTGPGTLALSGNNAYSGGTVVSNGVLQFNSLAALGTGTTLGLGAAATNATLRYASGNTADISTLTVTLNAGGGTIDTNGNDVTLANPIGNSGTGGLTKTGAGILTLSGSNTYTGTTTINSGTVSVGANASLGTEATGAPLIFTGTGGKLATTASFGLFNGAAGINDRAIALSGTDGTLAPATGTTLTVSGAITGTGKLNKLDAGQVTIQNATALQNTYSGGTLASAGKIVMADANANAQGLGTGTVTLDGGTVQLFTNANLATDTGNFASNIVVDGGFTGALIAMARGTIGGSLTGSGTLNFQTDYVRAAINGNWSAFTGQINVTPNTNGGDFRINNTNGFGTARINLANLVTMYMNVNFGAGGLTNSIGELTGGATSFLRGGPTAGRVMTWSVGGANTNAQFDGVIQDGTGSTAITKVGAGTWTLTGSNTYSSATAVSSGILNIQSAAGLGTTAAGTAVANGATLQLQGGIIVGAEALTLNGGAAAGQSGALVNVSGTNTYGGAITVAASSSISALTGSTLNLTGGVAKNGTTATFNGGGTINVSTVGISGAAANSDLVVDGAGTKLAVSVASTYNGPTTIQNGSTLEVSSGGSLVNTTAIAVNSGGTLLLSGTGGTDTKLNTASTLNLNSGSTTVAALDLSGLTSSLDQTLGVLTLSADSIIDFGLLAAGNTLRFASSSAANWGAFTLNIWNWSGNTVTGGGLDRLYFGTNASGLTPSQLSQINFYSDGGANKLSITGAFSANGFVGAGEIVPVPEPSGVAAAMGLLGLAGWRERRKSGQRRRETRLAAAS